MTPTSNINKHSHTYTYTYIWNGLELIDSVVVNWMSHTQNLFYFKMPKIVFFYFQAWILAARHINHCTTFNFNLINKTDKIEHIKEIYIKYAIRIRGVTFHTPSKSLCSRVIKKNFNIFSRIITRNIFNFLKIFIQGCQP